MSLDTKAGECVSEPCELLVAGALVEEVVEDVSKESDVLLELQPVAEQRKVPSESQVKLLPQIKFYNLRFTLLFAKIVAWLGPDHLR